MMSTTRSIRRSLPLPRYWVSAACIACLSGSALAAERTTIYVSPKGNDNASGLTSNPGNSGPVATLSRAVAMVRELKAQPGSEKQFVILLSPGTYRLNSPLALDDKDSGTQDAPTIIQGTDAKTVRITGTVQLGTPEPTLPSDVASRIPSAARFHVLAFDLEKNGVPTWIPIQTHEYSLYGRDEANELFVNGQPQTLASWPKTGYTTITKVPDPKGLRFSVASDHPTHWADTTNAWAAGFWFWDWAYSPISLAAKPEPDGMLSLANASHYGMRPGQRVHFLNIPEELDSAGSWYFDYQKGFAYVWPDASQGSANIELSVARSLISLSGTRHLKLSNLTLDGARQDLIEARNVQDFVIDQSMLRNSGRAAVSISGAASGITRSTIENAGAAGVELNGGDRQTLSPGNLFVSNDVISNFGRTYRTMQPGVRVEGVGNHVEHNRIFHGPHQAIYFFGNDHTISFNEIYDVVSETADAGAIYTGRDWTARGTVINYNYLHNIHGVVGGASTGPSGGATGVYIDDQASGIFAGGNIFFDVYRAFNIGGGLDNTIHGNLIVKSSTSIYMDSRVTNQKDYLMEQLKAVPYQQGAYRAHYPQLAKIVSDGLGTPRRNSIQGNVIVQSGAPDIQMSPKELTLQQVTPNLVDDNPGFLKSTDWSQTQAPPATAFQFAPQSKALGAGFKPVPLEHIGPGN